jgi:acyl dehydratase
MPRRSPRPARRLAAFRERGPEQQRKDLAAQQPGRGQSRWLKEQGETTTSKDNPEAHCLPMGNMQFHTQGRAAKVASRLPELLVDPL